MALRIVVRVVAALPILAAVAWTSLNVHRDPGCPDDPMCFGPRGSYVAWWSYGRSVQTEILPWVAYGLLAGTTAYVVAWRVVVGIGGQWPRRRALEAAAWCLGLAFIVWMLGVWLLLPHYVY